MLSKYLLPPDVYLRHCLVAKQIKDMRRILDVGGSLGELKKLLPETEVITADVVAGGSVVYDGANLPFRNNEFEAVVSVDTMEHISPSDRISWLNELFRVAKRKVIVVAPFRSAEHEVYENELITNYQKRGLEIPGYLLEHSEFGLPDMDLVERIKKRYKSAKIVFVGNVADDKNNFTVHTFEVKNRIVNKILYYSKFAWNIANNIFCRFKLKSKSDQNSSRLMIVIEK